MKSNRWQPPHVEITTDDKYVPLLRKAYNYSWKYSHDNSTKTSSLICDKNDLAVICSFANQFPAHFTQEDIQTYLTDRDLKLSAMGHAEERCSKHFLTKQWRLNPQDHMMVAPWYACDGCAKDIIDSGIEFVVGHEEIMTRDGPWKESITRGLENMHKKGITMLMYRGKVGDCKALFSRTEWSP